jgi:hypothetical protein
MAADQSTLSRKLTVSAAIVICCAAAFAVVYGPRFIVYHFARDTYHDPLLAVIPQPLKDYTVNSREGMSFSQFGYEFEAPWKDVDRVDNLKSLTRIYFKGGQFVLFFDPNQKIDRLKVMQDAAAQNGKDLRVLFGSEIPASNYQALNTILSTTPHHESHLIPSNDLVRNGLLLALKRSELVNGASCLYSVGTQNLLGFQKGDPLDKRDRHFEVWVGAQKGTSARITQADINRIVQTLHPIPEQK